MNIDWFTFAAQIINFCVLVYLLSRFLYGPVTRAMAQRENAIALRLADAKKQQREAEAAETHYLELSGMLKQQREDLLDQAKAESEAARQTLVADARAEIQSMREDWEQALHRDQNGLIDLVRHRASQQVIDVSRLALSQLADIELEQQTLETFLRRLGELPADQVEQFQQEIAQGEEVQIITAYDLTKAWQEKIRVRIQQQMGLEQVVFSANAGLICGIELRIGGSKVGWSVRDYLDSLADELEGMLSSNNGS